MSKATGGKETLSELGLDLKRKPIPVIEELPEGTPTSIRPEELPTTQREANGAKKLYDAALKESTPELAELLRRPEIHACATGITPVVELTKVSDAQVEALKKLLEKKGSLVIVDTHSNGEHRLVNIAAAKRVITSNADLFPEQAISAPESWLRTGAWANIPSGSTESGDKMEARQLLLAGLPREAAEQQRRYRRVKEQVRKAINVERYRAKYDNFAVEAYQGSTLSKEMLEAILEIYTGQISDAEKDLLRNQIMIELKLSEDGPAIMRFVGFSAQHDQEYVLTLKKIHEAPYREVPDMTDTLDTSDRADEKKDGPGIVSRILGKGWIWGKKGKK